MQDQPQDAASRFAAVATERLWLRPWKEADLPAFAALNADPRVMEFLPKVLSRTESDARAARIVEHFHEHGFGLWAVEVKAGAGKLNFQYEVRLSHEHDLQPVYFMHTLDGRLISEWRATRMKQTDGVWYAAEGEMSTPTRWQFKVQRFDVGKRLPEEAMRYVIPDGALVNDQILAEHYIQGRPTTKKSKPLSVMVRDVANRPVAEATVKLAPNRASRDQARQPPLEQITDAAGLAHFDAVPDEMLFLQVSKAELRPAAIIVGGGQEITMYLTPRTSGRVIDADGNKPNDAHVVAMPISQEAIESPPAESRELADVGPDGRFELTQNLTLRRLTDPLLFIAYSKKGQRMAIEYVLPGELGEPLDFVLEPAVSVAAKLTLPRGTPDTTKITAHWTDAKGRPLMHMHAPLWRDAASGNLCGAAVGLLPPGDYQLRVDATDETDLYVGDFSVDPDQAEVALDDIPLRPSKFASLRGQPAPELSAMPMPPGELKPLSSLHGQIVVLYFWRWMGEKFNDHPEQTPFFTLPSRFKDQPVYWMAVHDCTVPDPEVLAAKVAGMRKAIWGDGPAPFASLVDKSEAAPKPETIAARTATNRFIPATLRGVTRARYGVSYGLVLIDRHGRVVGSYSQTELEPALRRLLDSDQ